jgi:hypothetical protein
MQKPFHQWEIVEYKIYWKRDFCAPVTSLPLKTDTLKNMMSTKQSATNPLQLINIQIFITILYTKVLNFLQFRLFMLIFTANAHNFMNVFI